MPTNSTVVTDDDVDKIIDQIKALDRADAEMELAARAGIDVSEARKQSAETRRKLLQFKSVYGANRM